MTTTEFNVDGSNLVDLSDHDAFSQGPPRAWFAHLREHDPLNWNPERPPNSGFWSLTRHEDVVAVNRDPETFSSEAGQITLEELDEESLELRKSMIETDGNRHRALRMILQRDFTPRHLQVYEHFVRELSAVTIERALGSREFDMVKNISAQVPIRVLAKMLGVPREDTGKLIDWGNQMITNSDPEYAEVVAGSPEADQYEHLPFNSPAAQQVFDYGMKLRGERVGGDGIDLVSRLANAVPVDGKKLTDQDFKTNFALLIIAGNETTRHTISHATKALSEHREQFLLLKEQPELIPNAVEEFLRWATPLNYFRRTAMRDVEMHGKTIREGDKVVMWFTAANRDPRVFERPDEFDVTRSPNDHVAFGKGGPHFCLGNSLARLEIRIVVEELLKRVDDIEVIGEPALVRSNLVHGYKRLPVRMTHSAA